MVLDDIENDVSTHSRTKAAAIADITPRIFTVVSTHSRTKAAAERERQDTKVTKVSTHSRTKAAASKNDRTLYFHSVSTHSRTKAAACSGIEAVSVAWFQHTAARRRLRTYIDNGIKKRSSFNTQPHEGGCVICQFVYMYCKLVSTHSRTKAAADILQIHQIRRSGFNTQPHEGGCIKFFTTLFN